MAQFMETLQIRKATSAVVAVTNYIAIHQHVNTGFFLDMKNYNGKLQGITAFCEKQLNSNSMKPENSN